MTASKDTAWRIILLGKTGSGKSATGNSILGYNGFKSTASPNSATQFCTSRQAKRFETALRVVDTPGMFDNRMSQEEIDKQMSASVDLVLPGPHAFVLVVMIGRFIDVEQKTIDLFRAKFGNDMLKYTIILFTRKDDLDVEEKDIIEYLNENEKLLWLLEEVDNRYLAINNRAPKQELDGYVSKLIKMIDNMLIANGQTFYTSEMLEKAETARKEKEAQLKKEERNAKLKKAAIIAGAVVVGAATGGVAVLTVPSLVAGASSLATGSVLAESATGVSTAVTGMTAVVIKAVFK